VTDDPIDSVLRVPPMLRAREAPLQKLQSSKYTRNTRNTRNTPYNQCPFQDNACDPGSVLLRDKFANP